MILSEDRQSHLAHVIVDGIWKDDLVEYTDDNAAIRQGKRAVIEFVKEMGTLDGKVRVKLKSLTRTLIEGSPEWDVMYRKYYDEEMNKRGQG